jgi:hypothetical protein
MGPYLSCNGSMVAGRVGFGNVIRRRQSEGTQIGDIASTWKVGVDRDFKSE